jgi:pimeloyl-ACP methyl ester carboxylesterase
MPTIAKTVVLVHGAFADGSSWNRVVPLLQAKGLRVICIQNPLTSLADDVAHTRRALVNADGPVVLVGHSWGGAVITEVGVHEKVSALVYVAAFAPAEGESASDSLKQYPPSPGLSHLNVDSEGFASMSAEAVANNFAQDLTPADTAVMAATQGPVQVACFETILTHAAWKVRPSWYVVSKQDRMLPVELLRATAVRINANVLEVDSSHVPQLSRPTEVAGVIFDAAFPPLSR